MTRSENTWEPEENLDCQELIQEYLSKQKKEDEKRKAKKPAKEEPKKKKAKATPEVSCSYPTNVPFVSVCKTSVRQYISASARLPLFYLAHCIIVVYL